MFTNANQMYALTLVINSEVSEQKEIKGENYFIKIV